MATARENVAIYLYGTLSGDSALTTLLGGSGQVVRARDIARVPLNTSKPGKLVIGPLYSGPHSGNLVVGHGLPAMIVTLSVWAVGSATKAADDLIDDVDERMMALLNTQDTPVNLDGHELWMWDEGMTDGLFDEVTKASGLQRRLRCSPVLAE